MSLQSFTSVKSRPHDCNATSAVSTSSRRVPTELRRDLPGPRSANPIRAKDTGPRLTATQIQKLLVIPKDLVTQKDYGKSKAGARIVPPLPLKEWHRNGNEVTDAKPKLTVTDLQKQFVIPKGLVTQKEYSKKTPGRTTKYRALAINFGKPRGCAFLATCWLITINPSCSCHFSAFAKGSYAGRLVEMMHYHRSEYSIWANATIREGTSSMSWFGQFVL
jgi:hypothetical protein